jgi:hypothetical protein
MMLLLSGVLVTENQSCPQKFLSACCTLKNTEGRTIRELRTVTESAFQEAFQQWKKCWERCIASRGDYFEGYGA